MRFDTLNTAQRVLVRIEAEVDLLKYGSTCDSEINFEVLYEGAVCAKVKLSDVLLCAGINYVPVELEIEKPELWWPRGYGDQPLYEVRVSVVCNGNEHAYKPIYAGLRTIELDISRISGERSFSFIVNGTRIFCKGANYIPSDSVYMRVTAERLETLVSKAAAANFNMLRIWGGGIYEREQFYDACDRHGILIWHDFMFSCAVYPDHRDEFNRHVEREMDYQTKRLNHRPCMAIWCGSNENQMCFPDVPFSLNKQYGAALTNSAARRIVRNNTTTAYWNSSPFGGINPNDENIGDIHHWHEFMMHPDIERRIDPFLFDETSPKFVSEYGYVGPPNIETINEYMDHKSFEMDDPIWLEHTNSYEKQTVARGIEKHYGLELPTLTLEQYLLYGGLVQMTMYEYSLESFRFKLDCSGSLFWMYNDAWGEIGWTVIDYSLRRKISYYGVKRAFSTKKIILRNIKGKVHAICANDTAEPLTFNAKVGLIQLDGSEARFDTIRIEVSPRSRSDVFSAPLPEFDRTMGLYVLLPEDSDVEPAVLKLCDNRQLTITDPQINVQYKDIGDDLVVTLSSQQYAHGVHTTDIMDASDMYFDLLPGLSKKIVIYKAAGMRPEFTYS